MVLSDVSVGYKVNNAKGIVIWGLFSTVHFNLFLKSHTALFLEENNAENWIEAFTF